MILNNSGQTARRKVIKRFHTPAHCREFWLERTQEGWNIGTNIYQYVHLLAAKCYRNGWEIVKGTTGNTYYFKVPLSEASVSLKVFEQTATEGRKAWGKQLGQRYGKDALAAYGTKRRAQSRRVINREIEMSLAETTQPKVRKIWDSN